MKSLNDLIWKPESDEICGDKHLASTLAVVGTLCYPTSPQTAICDVPPPDIPQASCPSIGPILITCSSIMGSCGGGIVPPQGAACANPPGPNPPGPNPFSGFGCANQ